MQIEVLKSKIHMATVTSKNLNYSGSIGIGEDIMKQVDIIEGEKVQVLNVNNGERLETYVINLGANSKEISIFGPAARRVEEGDKLVIISYMIVDYKQS